MAGTSIGRAAPVLISTAGTFTTSWRVSTAPIQSIRSRVKPDGASPTWDREPTRRSLGDRSGSCGRTSRTPPTTRDPASTESRAVRLTHHGFQVSTPRYSRDGRLFYSLATPQAFPALMELPRTDARAGGSPAEPRLVTTRYLGGAIGLWDSRLIIDELELVQSVALQSDLWMVDPRTGDRVRLTREARAGDPDVSPDGSTIVCTIQMADRRALATLQLGTGTRPTSPQPIVSETDAEFAVPRWSPDGRTIAAERRIRGGPAEIVLVDVCLETGAHARQPSGRTQRIAGMDARRRARAFRGGGRHRAVPDLPGRRGDGGGFAARRNGPKRAVSGRVRGRRARSVRRQHRRRLRSLHAAARRRAMDPGRGVGSGVEERDSRRGDRCPWRSSQALLSSSHVGADVLDANY